MYILNQNNNKKEIYFYYSFNDHTTFIDLIEYISSLYPEYNFCPCYSIGQKQTFNNNDIIVNKINNNFNKNYYYYNHDQDLLYLSIYCYKCSCNEIVRNNYKLSKYKILDEYNKKEKKIQSLEKDNQNNLNKINSLERDKKIKENKIQSLENDNQNNFNRINSLQKDKKIIENKIQSLENDNQNNLNKINNLQRDKEKKEKKINKIQKERDENLKNYHSLQKKKEEEIGKLKKEKEIIEMAVNDPETLNNLEKLGVGGPNLKPKNNVIQIDKKTNQIKGDILKYEKLDPNNFYDIIVDIKSIKDINKGWEIKMKEEGKNNYNKYKYKEILKVGVIGNMNKGKSFLLSKISKMDLPSGTSIRTEGLSVKYPEIEKGFKNRRIALLDSAGLETPVLKDVDFKQTENGQNDDIKKKEKEYFREKSKEKIITELFLQRYIINNSDILIIVVGILSYSEQKLLNKIKNEIQKAKLKKTLFIIHNLITYNSISQVEEYINNTLLKSATFELKQGHGINTKINTKDSDIYYFEKNTENTIYHLIYANEGSEAGKKYNLNTLNFIERSYSSVTDLKPFDVITTLKKSFIEISKEIIEKTNNQKPLELTDFCEEANKLTTIKLNNQQDITLKRCLIDELGFSNLRSNGFEPKYNFYKETKDNIEKIVVRVEAPGNCDIESTVEYIGENTMIKLQGNKKPDQSPKKLDDNLYNIREFGFYSIEIPLKTEDFMIKNIYPTMTKKSGLLILEYLLENKSKGIIKYGDEDEDEV